MSRTLIRDARLITPTPGGRGDVLIEDARIVAVGPNLTPPSKPDNVIDAKGRVLMPGFVDAHTHACWAGDRLDEWQQRLAGVPYLEILAKGGGILSTVRAVRAASEDELSELLLERLNVMLAHGTTTVEVKSGYGLTTADELKMLRAIRRAGERWPGTLVPTALLGHAIDPEQKDFVETVINETLPAVRREFPGICVDAFCEKGAWSVEQTLRLLRRAGELGHPVRVHTDQFNALGMIPHALRLGARSVDHLEAATLEDLDLLASSPAFAVVLPCSGFHVDGRYANVRTLRDKGGRVVVATNCNPGSAPVFSMPMALSLAVRFCGLRVPEAIESCTVNAASLLGFQDRGGIRPGARADLVLLRHRDEREIAHEIGGNPADMVICGGRLVRGS